MTSEGTGYVQCQLPIIQHFILSIKLSVHFEITSGNVYSYAFTYSSCINNSKGVHKA